VKVTAQNNGDANQILSAVTTYDGTVQITALAPGNYWITADLLGINAAHDCIHVKENPSEKAARLLNFDWGDMATTTRLVAGKLVYSKPGEGGNPIWNLIHQVQAPITGASLTLQNPLDGANYHAATDDNGAFLLPWVPDGTYVLHIEGGNAGEHGYEETNLLLKISSNASRDTLLLTRREPVCGGRYLELVTTQTQ
jgi:hypothetical protein